MAVVKVGLNRQRCPGLLTDHYITHSNQCSASQCFRSVQGEHEPLHSAFPPGHSDKKQCHGCGQQALSPRARGTVCWWISHWLGRRRRLRMGWLGALSV